MQLRLKHYEITYYYLPLRRFTPRGPRRGMAERLLRAYFERQGWMVWRGGILHKLTAVDIYPNVQKKYAKLQIIVEQERKDSWEFLQLLCAVHYGMPDFVMYRRGVLKFVECKLGHEQLNDYQKNCLPRLKKLGFIVEVWKLVDECTKTRCATINILTREKKIHEQQLKLTKKLAASH